MEKELPKGWVNVELRFLGEYINGRAFKPTEWKENGLPIIRIQNLNDSTIAFNFSSVEHEPKYLVKKGELLMAWSASLGVYIWERDNAWLNQHIFKVLENKTIVTKRFLFYSLQVSINEFYKKTHGSGIVHITKPVFEAHIIPLPPLPEQQRIVAKLDTLFGHHDALKTRLEHIPQLLKEFRQKVLTQAVTSKLTEEWREGRELEECDLDYFCESSFYGLRFSTEEYSASGYPTVRTTDMTDNGFISIGLNTPRVSIQDKKKIELYKINSGDLLITRTGSIGKMARYIGEEIAIPSAYLIRFRFNEKALTDFIYYCLTSPDGQNQMGLSSTAITQPNLNAQKIRALKIPNLPIEEQKEIVHRVESLFAKADQIEAGYQKLKAKVEQLPQALLAKAFRGELMPQLPTDGDARDLLEEIKKAKAGK